MKIKNNKANKIKIEFLNDCLLIDNCVLVLGDFHLGYGESIGAVGLFLDIQTKEILKKLKNLFHLFFSKNIHLKKIIIIGDFKHEFGSILDSEWRESLKIMDYLSEKCKDVLLIKGNHDNILEPIAKKRNLKLLDFYKYKNVYLLHGNKLYRGCLEKEIDILITGHLHPAISLSDNYKKEKYKCFLKGKWKKKIVYVLPSFSPASFGYNLARINKINKKSIEDGFGFFIIEDKKLKNFEVIIYNNQDKKKYNFGKLKNLLN